MSKYVLVIGGANIDIGGRPYEPLVSGDSNPGRITTGCGGVGRNIAHALAKMNVPVKLVTALGDDYAGKYLKEQCEAAGIDMSLSLTVPGEPSSMYLYINEYDGDMSVALSHMEIVSYITPEYIDSISDFIRGAAAVVMDCNVSQETFLYVKKICNSGKNDFNKKSNDLSNTHSFSEKEIEEKQPLEGLNKNCSIKSEAHEKSFSNDIEKIPLYIDPVSTAHAQKIKGHLDGIDTLKPNRLEAEFLTGMIIKNDADFRAAAYDLIGQGVRRVFISMGEGGVMAADKDACHIVEGYPTEVVNTTGAGDSATAAVVWASLTQAAFAEKITNENNHYSTKEEAADTEDSFDKQSLINISLKENSDGLIFAAKAANAAASIAVASAQTINPDLSSDKIIKLISMGNKN